MAVKDKAPKVDSEGSGNTLRASKRREQIWQDQDGKCCYCDRDTILPRVLVEKFVGEFDDAEQGFLIDKLMADPRFKRRWHDDLATIEHLIPKAAGGTDARHNLAMACARCNQEKGTESHRDILDGLAMTDKTSRRMQRRGYRWSHELGKWIPSKQPYYE